MQPLVASDDPLGEILVRRAFELSTVSTPAAGLNRKDAAAYLGISTRYLDKLATNGEIRRCKFGAKTIFLRSELDRALHARLQATEAK